MEEIAELIGVLFACTLGTLILSVYLYDLRGSTIEEI
jgi:hypothetical protein